MKKIFLSIILTLPLIFMSCTNKITDKNKPNEETNITENNNKLKENNEIKEDDTVKKEEEPKENVEKEPAAPENIQVISPTESLVDSRFGYLKSIYVENGEYYLSLDEIEIFFAEEAVTQANLDNKNLTFEKDETIGSSSYDSYYLRNNYSTLTYFPIANDAKFYLCGIQFKENGGTKLFEVSLEKFIESGLNSHNPVQPTDIMIWADIQDGVAIKLYQEILPSVP